MIYCSLHSGTAHSVRQPVRLLARPSMPTSAVLSFEELKDPSPASTALPMDSHFRSPLPHQSVPHFSLGHRGNLVEMARDLFVAAGECILQLLLTHFTHFHC